MVGLKGTQMPENCYECPFDYDNLCHADDDLRRVESIGRPEWCRFEDAEPVRRGHWVGIDDFPHETWECDRCGKIIEADEPPNYCERCGAKMGGGCEDA